MSGNGNHGIVSGATLTTDRCGNPNSAYYFNGASYIKVPHTPSLNNHTNELTISFWVYSTGKNMAPVCKSEWQGNPIDYRIYLWDYGTFNFICNGQSSNLSYMNIKNQWFQFVFVYDKGLFKLYRDGVRIMQQNAATSTNLTYTTDLYIGADPAGLVEYMSGKIDDIYIYNRALTDNEIICLYYQSCPLV